MNQLRFSVLVLLAVLAVAHVQRTDWVPAGPTADDPELSPGDDWDARLHAAVLGELSVRRRRVLHWDPYAGFGSPAVANPEGYMLHPSWIAGTAWGNTWFSGLQALYWTALFILFGGSMALARRLDLPALAGLAAPLFLLDSWEWNARLSSGHLFILGAAMWPAAAACAHAGLDEERGRAARLLWGAGAGAFLGAALLGGSHYAMPMGLMIVLLVIWATGGPKGPVLALVVLLVLPMLGRGGPPVGRLVIEIGIVGVLLLGLRDRPRERFEVAAGTALGMVATVGAMLVIGLNAVSTQGRLAWANPASTGDLFVRPVLWEAPARLERIVSLPDPLSWALVGLGCLGLLLRRPAIGLAVIAAAAAAFTQGSPWKPWLFWAGIPGTSALGSVARWSWVLLIFSMLGLPALAAAITDRVAAEHPNKRRFAGAAALATTAAVVVWIHADLPSGSRPRAETPPLSADAGAITKIVIDANHPIALALVEGTLRARREAFDYGWMLPPEAANGALVWGLGEGCPVPAAPSVSVQADIESWIIRAPSNHLVVLAQRAVPGWTCTGAEILDGWALLEPTCRVRVDLLLHGAATRAPDDLAGAPPPEQQWLTIRTGSTGVARCTWSSPGWRAGLALQGAALLCVLGLGVAAISRRATARAPSRGPEAPG
jgi:hypothetical protein